jgi:hypothetical protein
MRFLPDDGRPRPVAVTSSTWGDLVVASGGRAQESEAGFSVGSVDAPEGEAGDELIDNTFFRRRDGAWYDAGSLARVTLHELTHDHYRVGAVGAWNTLGYYAVVVFTLRTSTHPAGDRPRATSEEFSWFLRARRTAPEHLGTIEEVREEHLAAQHPHCEHGPFAEERCARGTGRKAR